MSTDADAQSPTILAGRYRLERRVAQGGMAEVWLATDVALSRQVAVKLLKPQLAADPVVAERFRREAIAVASVTHPNIVAVYDAVEDNGRQAVVMQYVQGKTLRQLLDEQKRLSPELTVHLGMGLAAALDAAHSAGLVHRDVKPGNVLVTPDGRVLLADFGIAKALGTGDDLTSDNVMMGTAKYLSPEQVRGRRLDGRADLYALGLVLYECLAGRVPFLGETDADTALARLQRDATDLTRLRPTLPHRLAEIVHRLMEREPEHRYPTGAAVREALAGCLAPGQDTSRTSASGVSSTAPTAPTATQTSSVANPPVSAAPTDRARPALYDAARDDTGRDRTPGTPTHLDPILTAAAERTPPGVTRGVPHKRMQQRTTPSMILLGVLLLLALVVGIVLWSAIQDDPASGSEGAVTTATPAPTSPGPGASTALAPAPVGITGVGVFDPDGDGTENDGAAGLAIDGNPDTGWYTVCYESPFFGGKRGVGLVVAMAGPTSGTLDVDVATGPWILHVYAADAEAPTTFEGWGDPIFTDFGSEPRTVSLDLRKDSAVLLLLKQGAPSDACSEANPNRGGIAEVSLRGR